MKKSEKIAAFTAGFTGYPLLELLWRGRTHWSMALAGGLALLLLFPICTKKGVRLICCKTAAVITAIELVFGILFNIILRKNVWDYSKMQFNLWGQICLPYCLLWLLLGYPIRLICCGLRRLCRNLP
jgi:hypothetical protein